jgi:hypothetical protein
MKAWMGETYGNFYNGLHSLEGTTFVESIQRFPFDQITQDRDCRWTTSGLFEEGTLSEEHDATKGSIKPSFCNGEWRIRVTNRK